MYNTKNHRTADELVIGGKLTFEKGAEPLENQADSTATTVAKVVEDLNSLLAKLKAAGFMAGDES